MPEWIHDRAKHLQKKNPSMNESTAFAIATQQSHATGHSPKGYGTAEGKREAKQKYDTPGDDEQKADPKTKTAGVETPFSSALVAGFCHELGLIFEKRAGVLPPPITGLGEIKSNVPKPTTAVKGRFSSISGPHTAPVESPSSGAKPIADAPHVRT